VDVRASSGVRVSIAIVVLLLVSGSTVAFEAAGGSTAHPPTVPLTPARGGSGSSLGGASSILPSSVELGGAERTLILYNETRFDYNASAISGTVGTDPGLAFDSENGTAWATGLSRVGASNVEVFDPATQLGVREMAAGGQAGIAYDNRTNTMWVTGDDSSANVTVFNASTYAVVKVVGTGLNPRALTYDWRTRLMYVVDFGTDNITEVNDSTFATTAGPNVGGYADGIAFDPASRNLYVAHQEATGNVTAFYQTGGQNAISITIPGFAGMGTIMDDPQNGMVYAVGASPGVAIIDAATNTSAGTIRLPGGLYNGYDGLALDTVHHRLYVSQVNGAGYGNVVSYQPAPTASTPNSLTNTSTGDASQPQTMVYDSADARVLVLNTNGYNYASSNVSEISTANAQIVGSVGIQRLPLGAVYDPVTGAVYVYDGGTGDVYEISATDQVEASAFAGYTNGDTFDGVGISGQLAFDPKDGTIFADWATPDEPDGYGVAQFSASTLTLVRNWTSGFSGPSGIAFDAYDNSVYVANYAGDNATVISVATGHESWVGTGENPIGVAYDSGNNGVYVVNDEGNNVTVINGSTVVTNIPVASDPWGDVYDPANGYVYVADYIDGELSVINGATNTSTSPISIFGVINGPAWLAYDSVNHTVIASLPGTVDDAPGYAGIALINATNSTYFGSLEYGDSIEGLAYDPAATSLFAVATYPGAVYQVYFGTSASSSPPPISTTLRANPASLALGQSTDLVATPTGGTLPYTFDYSTLPTGCSNANETPLPCTPTAAGTYYVGVNVTDPTGGQASAATELVVTYTPATLQVTLTPTPDSIPLGGSLDLETGVTGGTGTGTYTFAYSTLPTGCSTQNLSSLPCAPTSAGTFYVGVNVTDPDGDHGSASARFAVTSAPPPPSSIAASLSANPSSLVLGNSSTLTVSVTGTPTGPLTYDYSVLPTGCTSANTSTLLCAPTAAGTFPLTVEVHDSAGHFAEANSSLVVRTSVAPSPSSSGSSSWIWILVALAVIVAIILIVILARRRKKETPPPSTGTPVTPPPPEPLEGSPPPPPS
jgi:YVTN family beta-propeller protein